MKKTKTMTFSLSVPLYELAAIQARMNLAAKTSQKQLQMISSMTRVKLIEIVNAWRYKREPSLRW
jgi:hypothetical protein